MNVHLRRGLALVLIFFPSVFKIPLYRRFFGYRIGKNVRIGFSWIDVDKLEIGNYVRIGHLTRLKNIPQVEIGDYCSIGLGNTFTSTREFTSPDARRMRGNTPRLVLGKHCQITMLHYFDVQDSLIIGAFTVIAGRDSIFFTHYLDIIQNRQSTKPIVIGDYCMVGARASFVPGASLADCSVVAMGSVVTRAFSESHRLIAGNPAEIIKELPKDAAYFHRVVGWVGEFAQPSPAIQALLQTEQDK